ncbi:MAG: hypothetical protein J0L70_03100 [Leptolyngbya sp. UWPOB_LEPTO1]|uniref:hypothetical protein n=1 Tax=Leptolyngbya sp. UWPOB_LEPTO1 TaxID=2815653 RepID=UPI001AD2B43D|nr:hypothetical protein [Leptolyngbya sp. UWPOB_LEPTO1]MBN8559490.1 hypothetical protein [Leptolyngbya sp. UWPOB_LEPTO1]
MTRQQQACAVMNLVGNLCLSLLLMPAVMEDVQSERSEHQMPTKHTSTKEAQTARTSRS